VRSQVDGDLPQAGWRRTVELGEVGDRAAVRRRAVGLEEPQHGDVDPVRLPGGGDDVRRLLPVRHGDRHRRQRAERLAGRVDEHQACGSVHER
jgi:hypothetical protein